MEDGDEFVVTGQKIWTSLAQVADYCELLVRTNQNGSKHKGISWLIMPMDSPGIEVRPLRTIENRAEFNQLFLNEVRIPKANLVGTLNDGWRVANVTFSFERGTSNVTELLERMNLTRDLAVLTKHLIRGDAPLWSDVGIRRDIGAMAAEFDALWALTKRNLSQAANGPLPMGAASVFKLSFSDALHRLGDLSMRVLGREGLSFDDVGTLPTGAHASLELWAFAHSIGGGTSQIQRKIIAERVLGLPRGT